MSHADSLSSRTVALGMHGLAAHLDEVSAEPWVLRLLEWEEQERATRGLARRIAAAPGPIPTARDFDWSWPKRIDRDALEESFRLDFISQAENLILLGPNGVGSPCSRRISVTKRFCAAFRLCSPPRALCFPT